MMNLYQCHLNTGDVILDDVTPLIAAESPGKAKSLLLAVAGEAGYECDWTTPVSIRIHQKDVDMAAGIVSYMQNAAQSVD